MSRKIFLVCLFATFCCHPCFASLEKMDKIVAVVNGDIVTEAELDIFMKMAVMDQDHDLKIDDPKELKKQSLDRLIEDRLILQEAKNKQLKVDDSQIEDRIRDIKRRAGSELAFEEALKNQGITLSDLRERLKNQFLIYSLIQKQVRNKAQVSPKEVTEYFEQHASDFVTPENVVVDSIFVEDKNDLEKVETELGTGKDFNEVARSYSKKSSLGYVTRGQLKKNLEDVIFSLDVGQCSKPVEVEGGYYLFSIKEKLAPSKKTIDEVKDKIAVDLENAKGEKILKEWIEGLKDKAYISIRE
jgi:parvulin-like peptidyl-prolyl isomerase